MPRKKKAYRPINDQIWDQIEGQLWDELDEYIIEDLRERIQKGTFEQIHWELTHLKRLIDLEIRKADEE